METVTLIQSEIDDLKGKIEKVIYRWFDQLYKEFPEAKVETVLMFGLENISVVRLIERHKEYGAQVEVTYENGTVETHFVVDLDFEYLIELQNTFSIYS